jgi:hypothetical protein
MSSGNLGPAILVTFALVGIVAQAILSIGCAYVGARLALRHERRRAV